MTQFEITSEINGWDYKSKSLYLANCLTGVARALLNELTAEQRRDYDSLVQKLTERYGSENRAEVFRSQLKSRVKGKGETTAQLAQAIRKLTRQAYPRVSLDVVEALAVDHFVDALPEAQIRLRLREVGPSTLAEAEKIAVRMEANITADKQRTRFVGKVDQNDQNKGSQNQTTEQQMENISKRIDMLSRSVQNLTQQQRPRMPASARNFPPQNQYNFPRPYRPDNRNMPFQRNYQSRGGNPHFNQPNNGHIQAQRNQVRPQGNFRQPAQGSSQAELEKGPEVIAMRGNWCMEEGYFVCVTIKNLPVTFLIDTGSNVTIMGKSFLEKLPSDIGFSVRPKKQTKMLTVTGEVTPFQGKTELELGIGKQKLKHTVLIADIENEGILGMDFLKAY